MNFNKAKGPTRDHCLHLRSLLLVPPSGSASSVLPTSTWGNNFPNFQPDRLILPVFEFYINGIEQYIFFCVSASFAQHILRFILLLPRVAVYSFSLLYILPLCDNITNLSFYHSWSFELFPDVVITKGAAVNILVYVFCWAYVCISVMFMTRNCGVLEYDSLPSSCTNLRF